MKVCIIDVYLCQINMLSCLDDMVLFKSSWHGIISISRLVIEACRLTMVLRRIYSRRHLEVFIKMENLLDLLIIFLSKCFQIYSIIILLFKEISLIYDKNLSKSSAVDFLLHV